MAYNLSSILAFRESAVHALTTRPRLHHFQCFKHLKFEDEIKWQGEVMLKVIV